MRLSSPVDRGSPRFAMAHVRMVCACTALCASFLFSADSLKAQDASQDVAEAARQARARKAEQAQRETHVYTNDDLQKPRILSDGDSAIVAARKPAAVTPPAVEAQQSAATPADEHVAVETPSESLGEVARRYRHAKEERQAAAARKDESTSPFHMERKMVPQPSFATIAPRPLVILPRPVDEPKKTNSPTGAIPARRDPFQRPGFNAPRTRVREIQPPAISVQTDAPVSTAISKVPNSVATASVSITTDATKRSIDAAPAKLTLAKPDAAATTSILVAKGAAPHSASVVPSSLPKPVTSHHPPPPSVSVEPSRAPPNARILSPRSPSGETSSAITTVKMRPGDSLWNLSRRYLGRGDRWQEWVSSNPQLPEPRRIRVGTVLALPNSSETAGRSLSVPSPATALIVQSGDSLWKISLKQFGSGSRWTCLQAANPGLRDANIIYPGERLQVPQACQSDKASLRPAP